MDTLFDEGYATHITNIEIICPITPSGTKVRLTDDRKNSWETILGNDVIEREQLKLKLIKAGASVADLQKFEQMVYDYASIM